LEPIERLIEPTLRSMGFELVAVRMLGGARPRLQVMAEPLDVAHGMTVEDCADISHAVSALLDVEDPIPGAYTLEVSSPGLDRPLVRKEHFERFRGERARLETETPIDGRRRFLGRLGGLEGDAVVIEVEGGPIHVPLSLIKKAKLTATEEALTAEPKPGAPGRKRKGKRKDGA
jgi:ribosome maturation factor RimP